MLFVRLLEPDRTDPNRVQDIRFADYRKLGGGWIAALVEVYVDAKKSSARNTRKSTAT